MFHVLKLVILDHDDVINRDSDQPIKSPDEWIAPEDSLEVIVEPNQAGYQMVVATDQPDVGHGLSEAVALDAMHEEMCKASVTCGGRVDAVFLYPHTAADACECRKPKSDTLREVARRFDVDLTGVSVVGDSLRNLQAGAKAGAMPHLVLTDKGTKTHDADDLPPGTRVHKDLHVLTHVLLSLALQGTPTCVP